MDTDCSPVDPHTEDSHRSQHLVRRLDYSFGIGIDRSLRRIAESFDPVGKIVPLVEMCLRRVEMCQLAGC